MGTIVAIHFFLFRSPRACPHSVKRSQAIYFGPATKISTSEGSGYGASRRRSSRCASVCFLLLSNPPQETNSMENHIRYWTLVFCVLGVVIFRITASQTISDWAAELHAQALVLVCSRRALSPIKNFLPNISNQRLARSVSVFARW